MMLPWTREPILPRPKMVSTKQLELEAAKQILAEVFHARPSDVEDMIRQRLEKKNWSEEREDGLWPATFCLGE